MSGWHKKILFLLLVAAIALSVQSFAKAETVFTDKVGIHNGADPVVYSRKDIREELRKKYEFDYKPYLKGEKDLGFTPDEHLYRQVYFTISLKYVEPVDDKTLIEGVFAEVGRLLKQAKVDAPKLDSIPRKSNPVDEIVQAYGDQVDPKLLKLACIRGLLEALDDPHSTLMMPDEYKKLKEQLSGGDFTGIGVFISLDSKNYNWLTVLEPIEGTPAYKAGLKPGDIITAINGESTKGQDIDLSVAKIRGPAGTVVKLTIKRKGEPEPFVVPIKRAFIHVNSVKAKLIGGNIGYLKLRTYGFNTPEEMEEALDKLEKKGAKALILDLRNNSGGLLDVSFDVCSNFLPRGASIVSVVNRAGNTKVNRATGGKRPDMPMVVLVNELSASAAEITAAALKDHKRAVLIGQKTFGKGSVQEPMPIGTGKEKAVLKLTVAKFYPPSGKPINKVGIEPDIKVPMELQFTGIQNYDKDIQLQKAVEYLRGKI